MTHNKNDVESTLNFQKAFNKFKGRFKDSDLRGFVYYDDSGKLYGVAPGPLAKLQQYNKLETTLEAIKPIMYHNESMTNYIVQDGQLIYLPELLSYPCDQSELSMTTISTADKESVIVLNIDSVQSVISAQFSNHEYQKIMDSSVYFKQLILTPNVLKSLTVGDQRYLNFLLVDHRDPNKIYDEFKIQVADLYRHKEHIVFDKNLSKNLRDIDIITLQYVPMGYQYNDNDFRYKASNTFVELKREEDNPDVTLRISGNDIIIEQCQDNEKTRSIRLEYTWLPFYIIKNNDINKFIDEFSIETCKLQSKVGSSIYRFTKNINWSNLSIMTPPELNMKIIYENTH